jgi:hypothetical protein
LHILVLHHMRAIGQTHIAERRIVREHDVLREAGVVWSAHTTLGWACLPAKTDARMTTAALVRAQSTNSARLNAPGELAGAWALAVSDAANVATGRCAATNVLTPTHTRGFAADAVLTTALATLTVLACNTASLSAWRAHLHARVLAHVSATKT